MNQEIIRCDLHLKEKTYLGGHKSGGRETGKRLEEYSRQEMMAGQNRMLIVEVKRNGYNFKVEE